jgi:hypothetical protein
MVLIGTGWEARGLPMAAGDGGTPRMEKVIGSSANRRLLMVKV